MLIDNTLSLRVSSVADYKRVKPSASISASDLCVHPINWLERGLQSDSIVEVEKVAVNETRQWSPSRISSHSLPSSVLTSGNCFNMAIVSSGGKSETRIPQWRNAILAVFRKGKTLEIAKGLAHSQTNRVLPFCSSGICLNETCDKIGTWAIYTSRRLIFEEQRLPWGSPIGVEHKKRNHYLSCIASYPQSRV
jgi:hypothetical protein